jgi:hypothetical protein
MSRWARLANANSWHLQKINILGPLFGELDVCDVINETQAVIQEAKYGRQKRHDATIPPIVPQDHRGNRCVVRRVVCRLLLRDAAFDVGRNVRSRPSLCDHWFLRSLGGHLVLATIQAAFWLCGSARSGFGLVRLFCSEH